MIARIPNKTRDVAILVGVALAFASAVPNDSPRAEGSADQNIMIVLDGSGSMWGKLGQESKTKLALSQKFLSDLLSKPSPKANWGLASFGHRRAGNCSDAQVIVPPAPASKDAILRTIEKHNPRGKGPLSLALTQTAEALDPNTNGAIVLVHDGYDNCRQDPCDVANAISQSHPKLAIHVISLDLPDDTVKAMSCLADKTGGRMYPVRTEAQFAKAANDIFETVTGAPSATAGEATSDATTSSADVDPSQRDQGPPRVRATASLQDNQSQSVRDVVWQILSPASPQDVLFESQATELTQRLEPGRYIVRGRIGLAAQETQITIEEKGESAVQLSFNAGVLQLNRDPVEKASPGGPGPGPAFVTLRQDDGGDNADDGAPLWIGAVEASQSLVVPAGRYRIDAQLGPTSQTQAVTVTAGETAPITLTGDYGVLQLSSTLAHPAPQADTQQPDSTPDALPNVTYVVRIDDPTQPGGRRELARSAAANAAFQLQPGTVYVEARLGQARQEQRFAISKGTVLRHAFAFNVAPVTLRASIGEDPVSKDTAVTYTIFDTSQGQPKRIAVVSRQSSTLTLPAGRYRVRGDVGPSVSGTRDAIDVTAGTPVTISVPLNAGRVTLKPATAGGAARLPRLQIRTDGDNGKVVWSGRVGRETTAILPPGRFVLEGRTSSQPIQRFAVVPGETIEVVAKPER